MRILIVNFEYPPLGGGGGVATKQLAEELAKKHDVYVLTTWHKGLLKSEICNGVHIERAHVFGRKQLPVATVLSMITFVPTAIWRGWRLLKQYSCDVINAQFIIPSGVPALILAKYFHTPLVVSLIGGDLYDPTKGISPHRHWLLRCVIRHIARHATQLTAISEDTKRRAQELHGIRGTITVTPIGLIPHNVSPALRDELGLPNDAPLFVSIGRLIPRKGYDVLIRAWKNVSNAHLAIVGDGPLQQKMINQIKVEGLERRVHLLGFISEEKKLQVLQVSDGYVSAAEHEGFGIVFLEAMEASLPIVAANEGGQTDFLTDNENALLVNPREPQELADAVNKLLTDMELSNRLKANNRQKVRDYYLDKTTQKFEAVLLKATNQKSL